MNWWHTIEFPDGTVTPGRHDYRGDAGKRFLVPDDLSNKSVLDLGTKDGFWAIEAKRRGAANVIAMDMFREQSKTSRVALGAYGIEYYCSGNLDYPMDPSWQNSFDIVFFFGILYHLKNPVLGLVNAAACCKPGGMVIVESVANAYKVKGLPEDIPLLWVMDEIVNNDPTNYYIPNIAGVLQLCRLAGLEVTDQTAFQNSRFTVVCLKRASETE
jgi:tRNA (mo5U34)-methyltransferase